MALVTKNMSVWSFAVKARDGACVKCGDANNLHAHHIKSQADFPELRFDLDNGRTLCRKCHHREHELARPFRVRSKKPQRRSLIKLLEQRPRPWDRDYVHEQDFEKMLKSLNMARADVAKSLGLSPRSVSAWGDDPPRYATAYLELLVEYNRVRP